jgi:hypothetical protein
MGVIFCFHVLLTLSTDGGLDTIINIRRIKRRLITFFLGFPINSLSSIFTRYSIILNPWVRSLNLGSDIEGILTIHHARFQ